MKKKQIAVTWLAAMAVFVLSGCAMVGPDFTRPEAPVAESWSEQGQLDASGLINTSQKETDHRD